MIRRIEIPIGAIEKTKEKTDTESIKEITEKIMLDPSATTIAKFLISQIIEEGARVRLLEHLQ